YRSRRNWSKMIRIQKGQPSAQKKKNAEILRSKQRVESQAKAQADHEQVMAMIAARKANENVNGKFNLGG
ncbi:hypothetical protein KAR91_67005, partial [Candidatus Pacearchaeota archaeon]|nr:hypothetical protein [Candidatus Pacearchaeota archaeon]